VAEETTDNLTQALHDSMPFAGTLGITVLRYEPAEVRARLAWARELCTAGGVLHGGVLMALADSTGGACAYLNLPDGAQGTTTVESKTNFIRAVRGGAVASASRPVHIGRTLIVVETDVRDERDRLIIRTSQTQLVLTGD
jgi:uncharacterized protein (TIGR00369 family)